MKIPKHRDIKRLARRLSGKATNHFLSPEWDNFRLANKSKKKKILKKLNENN